MLDYQKVYEKLTGAKRRECMGCWGLLWLLFIVSQWIIPENSLLSTSKKIMMMMDDDDYTPFMAILFWKVMSDDGCQLVICG